MELSGGWVFIGNAGRLINSFDLKCRNWTFQLYTKKVLIFQLLLRGLEDARTNCLNLFQVNWGFPALYYSWDLQSDLKIFQFNFDWFFGDFWSLLESRFNLTIQNAVRIACKTKWIIAFCIKVHKFNSHRSI